MTREIAILDYPGAQQAALHGLTDMFLSAKRVMARRAAATATPAESFGVSHWRPGDSGTHMTWCDDAARAVGPLSAAILPPSLSAGEGRAPTPAVLDWLRARHRDGTVLTSICYGAFYLAETGLLDGRPATTHWALEESFATRFPAVRLDTDKLIVEDGDIVTAGGVMAWVDLGLRLIDRFAGPTVMLEVARLFLVDPGGREQRFYSSFAPNLQHGDDAILKLQHWLQGACDESCSIAVMAAQAGLSERTFLRRFQRATGLKPSAYLQRLRVGKARELLELTAMPFQQIAWQVGYEDAGAFRRVFQRILGLSPGDYRRRFRMRREIQ